MEMVTLAILEMVVIAIIMGYGFKVNKDFSVAVVLMTVASIIFNATLGMAWYFMIIPLAPVGAWVYRIAK